MKPRKWGLPGIVVLFMIMTASTVHAAAVINNARIGDTTVSNQSSPWNIEGQTFTWNGVNVVVTRYPSGAPASTPARIEIVADTTGGDTIGIFNAKFTATGAVTNFPINFESTGLVPPPTTPPQYYYTQGSGLFTDNSPLNGILTTVGKINPTPGQTGWNQIGNTLTHNTGACSCLTFGPGLGYKTYASSTFSNPRGLRGEILLTLGAANEAVGLTFVKVHSGPPPGTDDSIEQTCEDVKEEQCEAVTVEKGFLCGLFGIYCPRCPDSRVHTKVGEVK